MHGTWIKLIKAKYLRGKQILDVQRSPVTVSWIWGSIIHSIETLRAGACYQIGASSSLNITRDPWIPSLQDFRIPTNLALPDNILHIKHLMEPNGKSWNSNLVSSIFPNHIKENILNTSILEMEHERLIWTPTSTGKFSIKATIELLRQHQVAAQNYSTRQEWNQLWSSKLHNRHKILI